MNEIHTYPICQCIMEYLRFNKDNFNEDYDMENKNVLSCNEHLKGENLENLLNNLEDFYRLKFTEFEGELINEFQNINTQKV